MINLFFNKNLELENGKVYVILKDCAGNQFYKNFHLNNFYYGIGYNKNNERDFHSTQNKDIKVFIIDSNDYHLKMYDAKGFKNLINSLFEHSFDLIVLNDILNHLNLNQKLKLLDAIHKLNKKYNTTVLIFNTDFLLLNTIFDCVFLTSEYDKIYMETCNNFINYISKHNIKNENQFNKIKFDTHEAFINYNQINWIDYDVIPEVKHKIVFADDLLKGTINNNQILNIIFDFDKKSLNDKLLILINILNSEYKTYILITSDILLLNLCGLTNKISYCGNNVGYNNIYNLYENIFNCGSDLDESILTIDNVKNYELLNKILNKDIIDEIFDDVIDGSFLNFIDFNYERIITQMNLKQKNSMLNAFKYQIEYYKSEYELHKNSHLIIKLIKVLNEYYRIYC